MSKAIIISNRPGQDKETKGDVLWLTLYLLPREYKRKDGTLGLFYPKKEDALKSVCISKEHRPDDFAKLKDVREGTLCVPRYTVDEYTGNSRIGSIDILPGTNKYTPEQLYKD